MGHLKLQAPRPSFDIAFSVMKAMQGIFAGAFVELAFCKSISRRGCASVISQKRWNRRYKYYGKIDGFASHIEYVNDKQIRC
jgi:hypothetical protein